MKLRKDRHFGLVIFFIFVVRHCNPGNLKKKAFNGGQSFLGEPMTIIAGSMAEWQAWHQGSS